MFPDIFGLSGFDPSMLEGGMSAYDVAQPMIPNAGVLPAEMLNVPSSGSTMGMGGYNPYGPPTTFGATLDPMSSSVWPPVPAGGWPTLQTAVPGAPQTSTLSSGPEGTGEATGGGTEMGASSTSKDTGKKARGPEDYTNKLLAGLRAIQPPPRPDVVKPSTPSLPRQTPINLQGGALMALLQQLGSPGKAAPTLGQFIGR